MATKLETLREEQESRFTRMREIVDSAEKQERELDATERKNWDELNEAYDKGVEEIRTLEEEVRKDAERRTRLDEIEQERSRGRQTDHNDSSRGNPTAEQRQKELRSRAQSRFIQFGPHELTGEEKRALQNDSDIAGGTLVPDEEFVRQLIKNVDDLVIVRQLATKFMLTSADSLGVPTLTADPADADWTAEIAIGGEDSTMATSKRQLRPHPLGKLLKVSRTLIRKSAIPVDALVRDRLAYKFAITEEQAFMTGSGAGQPLGVFTAHADGITTSQDVSTGNTTTAITADGLINCKFDLKSQYMASPALRWVFHRDAVKEIRKLKDGNGQYLWTMGLAGAPDTILEVPYFMSEYASNTFTSQLYVGIIGDFRHYWIADALNMELQRVDELYAATNQVGFIGRMELDGTPVLAEAFRRVKLA